MTNRCGGHPRKSFTVSFPPSCKVFRLCAFSPSDWCSPCSRDPQREKTIKSVSNRLKERLRRKTQFEFQEDATTAPFLEQHPVTRQRAPNKKNRHGNHLYPLYNKIAFLNIRNKIQNGSASDIFSSPPLGTGLCSSSSPMGSNPRRVHMSSAPSHYATRQWHEHLCALHYESLNYQIVSIFGVKSMILSGIPAIHLGETNSKNLAITRQFWNLSGTVLLFRAYLGCNKHGSSPIDFSTFSGTVTPRMALQKDGRMSQALEHLFLCPLLQSLFSFR